MTRQVVHNIFPDRRRAQHSYALGKAQCFTNQAAIHVPRGQVGAFNVSRVRFQVSQDLLRIAKDHTQLHTDHAAIFALLDQLQILPILARLLERWRASTSAVVRHFTVYFNQRFPMTAPSIRDQRRRRIGMTTPFELV